MGWPTVRRVAAAGLVGLLVPGAVGAAGIAGATGAVYTARTPRGGPVPLTGGGCAMTGVRLRPATVADAPAIARIRRVGWPDGHHGHVPAGLAAERTPVSFDQRTSERIGWTWVAEAAGAVAGFVVVVDAEVEQRDVDRSRRGRGVAERLLGHPRR